MRPSLVMANKASSAPLVISLGVSTCALAGKDNKALPALLRLTMSE